MEEKLEKSSIIFILILVVTGISLYMIERTETRELKSRKRVEYTVEGKKYTFYEGAWVRKIPAQKTKTGGFVCAKTLLSVQKGLIRLDTLLFYE